MEPRIQYAKTSDGVNIAYATLGEGTPLVSMPHPFAHLQLDWEIPGDRRFFERLGENRLLVRYDRRGTGLSDREVADLSQNATVRDLEAVVDSLGLERFALFASALNGPVGIAYAVRHPERVSHLVLWHSYIRITDITGVPEAQALTQLANANWEMYTETLAHVVFGWSEGEEARQYAAVIRESITQEGLEAFAATTRAENFHVTELLPEVKAPTLVLQRREATFPSVDTARGLASGIPNARLILLEGMGGAPHVGDAEPVHRAIEEFLGEGEETETPSEGLPEDIVHTILFTDVEGSTALTDRLGDSKARALLREHERIVREALKSHGGSEVKTMGDGFMASFSSATKALDCAIALQTAFAKRNESAGERINVRIGLNAGEPIEEDEDLFGTAVNMAARIAANAEGGEIVVSNVVRELVAGKKFMFNDRGETELRGFEDPVRLFEVRWREE